MRIEYLEWDSNFFGLKIGKIEIRNDIFFDIKLFQDLVKSKGFDLVYIFKYNTILKFSGLIDNQFDLVDIMLTMSKAFIKDDYLNQEYEFRTDLTEKELSDCYGIAETTAIVSRFYKESIIGPKKAKELYRKWIDNALNKSCSDGLFVVKDENNILGIHIIKTDIENKVGHCSLIGVSPIAKKSGFGRNLWEQAHGYWALQSNIKSCNVPFSLQNKESFNFHLKMGFNKIEEIKYVYHYKNTNK